MNAPAHATPLYKLYLGTCGPDQWPERLGTFTSLGDVWTFARGDILEAYHHVNGTSMAVPHPDAYSQRAAQVGLVGYGGGDWAFFEAPPALAVGEHAWVASAGECYYVVRRKA